MLITGVEGERYILVDAVPLGAVFIGSSDHAALQGVGGIGRQNANAALVGGDSVPAALIQRPAGLRLIEAGLRIIRQHGMRAFGAYPVGFALRLEHHGLIVSTGAGAGVERLRDIAGQIPIVAVKADRLEQRLVVVGRQGGGFVYLRQRSFASAVFAAADLQRHGISIHHQRLIVAAHAVGGGDGLGNIQRAPVPGIHRVILINRRGYHASPERGRHFLLIPDAVGFGAVLCTEAGALKNGGMMPVILRHQCASLILRHGNAAGALGIDAPGQAAACRSSAVLSTAGSSLPRADALRRIPRQAVGLK